MGCGASAGDSIQAGEAPDIAREISHISDAPELVRELSGGAPEKKGSKEPDIQLPERPESKFKPQPPPKITLPDIKGDHFIKVQCITGQLVTQKVNVDDTIRVVKARLAQTEGGPLQDQRFRLVFEGRDLPATQLVGAANLGKGATVMAVLLRADVGELECPEAGGRVHFTGGLVLDHFVSSYCSEAYVEDSYSEYVGIGNYPDNEKAFPRAIAMSFDGIIVDAGTRVTIYSQKNFKGEVLWDRVGPAIVCNQIHENLSFKDNTGGQSTYKEKLFRDWKEPLNSVFPKEVREFSGSNMYQWHLGSVVIQGGQPLPEGCTGLAAYASASKPEELA